MSNKKDILNYSFSDTDRLFFDNNIWMYIYGPQGSPSDKRSRIYSNAYREALKAKSKIFIDVLVLSEFINRCARIEFDIWKKQKSLQLTFKDFRNSPDFLPIARSIGKNVRNIMKYCQSLESGFTKINLENLCNDFESTGNDFNDQVILNLCQTEELILISHDGDFKDKDVNILSANKKILQ